MKHTTYITALIILLYTLAACSSDTPEPTDEAKASPFIGMGVDNSSQALWHREACKATRTGSTTDIKAAMPQSIGVWGFNDRTVNTADHGIVFQNQEMFYINGEKYQDVKDALGIAPWGYDNDWPYAPQRQWLGIGTKYKFFAYTPYTDAESDLEVHNASYSELETFTWKNIPKYSSEDYMVSSLRSYTAKAAPNDHQLMAMRHLHARLRFCFKLGPNFGDRRKIVVKSVKALAMPKARAKTTINLEDGTTEWTTYALTGTETVPLHNDVDDTGATIESIELSAAYNKLAQDNPDEYPEYQAIASIYVFAYENLESIRIGITYDVYDIEGQLLRQNDSASNILTLNLQAHTTGTKESTKRYLQPGYYNDIRIKVEPDYMYVLSDNDPPAITLETSSVRNLEPSNIRLFEHSNIRAFEQSIN